MDEKLIWQFTYHKGPQQLVGHCYGTDEIDALEEATLICQQNRWRAPAAVRPFIMTSTRPVAPTPEPAKKTITDRLVGALS